MNYELLGNLVTAALAVRVFGSDLLSLLRRVAAAGVRVGISELDRDRRGGEAR
ncbi:hypothetical protein IHE55_13735 [Streptomyces pactum]|uniref:Gas vesicle protein n=1 Tax=Streptomyces pactum TaxID=68249 RepID=A0ABS0NKR1_9ACTN|nr:hypothetical protein [Streptomyces pactum]MBH5335798.1 hypothetical protein [Streptomyces pactum]